MENKKIHKKNHIKFLEESKVKLNFTKKTITSYGGFWSIAKLFEKIKLKENLEKIISMEETSPNSKGIFSKIIQFSLTVLAGGKRFSHSMYLGDSLEVYEKLFNVKSITRSVTAVTRFFNKFCSWQGNNLFAAKLWHYICTVIIPFEKIKEDYLGVDTTVITRYGNQEGAKKGYNPKKKGRASHHPLYAFLNRSSYIVNIWNRSGNTGSANNIINFLKETLERLQGKIKILGFLADSGFYDIHLIEYLESILMKYIIGVPISYILQREIFKIENWRRVDEGIYAQEFYFEHKDEKWTKPRRYIVIKQKCEPQKEAPGKQLSLFLNDMENSGYRFGLYITTNTDDPETVWRRYRLRADDENKIKENKYDFGMEGFSLNGFYATEAALMIRTLLYNIFNFFRSEVLPKHESMHTLQTIRHKYFIVPGIFGKDGRINVLRLGLKKLKNIQKTKWLINRIDAVFRDFKPNALQLEGLTM